MVQWLFILVASYLAFQVGRLLGREEVYEQWQEHEEARADIEQQVIRAMFEVLKKMKAEELQQKMQEMEHEDHENSPLL